MIYRRKKGNTNKLYEKSRGRRLSKKKLDIPESRNVIENKRKEIEQNLKQLEERLKQLEERLKLRTVKANYELEEKVKKTLKDLQLWLKKSTEKQNVNKRTIGKLDFIREELKITIEDLEKQLKDSQLEEKLEDAQLEDAQLEKKREELETQFKECKELAEKKHGLAFSLSYGFSTENEHDEKEWDGAIQKFDKAIKEAQSLVVVNFLSGFISEGSSNEEEKSNSLEDIRALLHKVAKLLKKERQAFEEQAKLAIKGKEKQAKKQMRLAEENVNAADSSAQTAKPIELCEQILNDKALAEAASKRNARFQWAFRLAQEHAIQRCKK